MRGHNNDNGLHYKNKRASSVPLIEETLKKNNSLNAFAIRTSNGFLLYVSMYCIYVVPFCCELAALMFPVYILCVRVKAYK